MTNLPATIPERGIPTSAAVNTLNNRNHTHAYVGKPHEYTNVIPSPHHPDVHTKTPISFHQNKDTNDIQIVDNPYNIKFYERTSLQQFNQHQV